MVERRGSEAQSEKFRAGEGLSSVFLDRVKVQSKATTIEKKRLLGCVNDAKKATRENRKNVVGRS